MRQLEFSGFIASDRCRKAIASWSLPSISAGKAHVAVAAELERTARVELVRLRLQRQLLLGMPYPSSCTQQARCRRRCRSASGSDRSGSRVRRPRSPPHNDPPSTASRPARLRTAGRLRLRGSRPAQAAVRPAAGSRNCPRPCPVDQEIRDLRHGENRQTDPAARRARTAPGSLSLCGVGGRCCSERARRMRSNASGLVGRSRRLRAASMSTMLIADRVTQPRDDLLLPGRQLADLFVEPVRTTDARRSRGNELNIDPQESSRSCGRCPPAHSAHQVRGRSAARRWPCPCRCRRIPARSPRRRQCATVRW